MLTAFSQLLRVFGKGAREESSPRRRAFMMTFRRLALLITWVGCASPDPAWKNDRREPDVSEARKIAACAVALDAVSLEAEKSYRAALGALTRGARRAALPVESAS